MTGEFPAQMVSNAKMLPFDEVIRDVNLLLQRMIIIAHEKQVLLKELYYHRWIIIIFKVMTIQKHFVPKKYLINPVQVQMQIDLKVCDRFFPLIRNRPTGIEIIFIINLR